MPQSSHRFVTAVLRNEEITVGVSVGKGNVVRVIDFHDGQLPE
jgi:hypothetical protein